ncbi:MAG: tetratricopeptide repeat protein [Thermodesulfobacteriota bacterium]
MDILGLRVGRADADLPAYSVYCEALSYLTIAALIAFTPFIKGPANYLRYTIIFLSANLLLTLWFLKAIHRGTLRLSLAPLTVLPVIFLVVIAASLFYTISLSATTYGVLVMGSFVASCIVTASTAPDHPLWGRLFRVVVIVSTLLSLYAITQYLTHTGNYSGRAHATFVNPNSFSGYLVLLLPLLMVLSIREGRHRYYLLGVVAVNYAALLATGAGGWWLVFVGPIFFVVVICWIFLPPNERKRLIPLTVMILSVTAFFQIPATLGGGGSMLPKASGVIAPMAERLHIWESTWEIIKGAPLLGRGFWTFHSIYPMYKNRLFEGVDHPFSHNDYLQFWAELGIVGLLVFLLLLFFYFRSGLRVLRTSNSAREEKNIVVGILSGSLFMLVHTNIDFDLYIPAILLIFWGYLGYMMSVEGDRGSIRTIEIPLMENPICRLLGARKLTIIVTALFLFSSLWLTKPYLASLYDKKGMALMTAGKTEAGVRLARKAVELFPYESSYHYNLGLALSNLDNGKDVLKEAEEEMKKAIALDPYRAELHFRVADFYKTFLLKERSEEAIATLKKAVELAPSNSTYLYNLGVLHIILGEAQPAIARLEEYLEWKPDDFEARLELAKAYGMAERYEEAIEEVEKVMAVFDAPNLHLFKGNLLKEMGRPSRALSKYRKAVGREGSEGAVSHTKTQLIESPRNDTEKTESTLP